MALANFTHQISVNNNNNLKCVEPNIKSRSTSPVHYVTFPVAFIDAWLKLKSNFLENIRLMSPIVQTVSRGELKR